MIGCTAVGVAGGGVEVEDRPGLSVFAASFGGGTVDGIALESVETDDGSRSSAGPTTCRPRHAVAARRSVLVSHRRLARRVQCEGSRASPSWAVSRPPATRAGREPARAARPCDGPGRGRAVVLRGRADARDRLAGLPPDRQAVDCHEIGSEPSLRARRHARDRARSAGARAVVDRRRARADAARAAVGRRRRRAQARLRARRLPHSQRFRRRPVQRRARRGRARRR